MKVYAKLMGLILSCVLGSCHSYKPLITNHDVSPEKIKEGITVGKKYEILTNGGRNLFVKVDSIREDRLYGDARVHDSGSTRREKNCTIYFADVESINQQKFSTGKTVAAVIVPIVSLALLFGALDPLGFSAFGN